ncbi:MAG: hypothetical protein ACR2P8_05590, partial [Myxococcota bacterium]
TRCSAPRLTLCPVRWENQIGGFATPMCTQIARKLAGVILGAGEASGALRDPSDGIAPGDPAGLRPR